MSVNSRNASALTPSRSEKSKPPFKLCFSRDQQLGKSDVCFSKIDGKCSAGKFYSREATESTSGIDVDEALSRISKEERKLPKDLYRWPLLSSQTYGWWYEKGIHPRDPRFNFHKRTSDLVSFQMKIYAEDRKLKGQRN